MINLIGKSPKILVIGDLMIDHYLWGTCERISPEAPVQVINIGDESMLLGGAGNVINNLNALGAHVDVISVIGSCEISDELRVLLSNINVSTKYLITQINRVASKKTRIISSQQQVVRFDHESTEEISEESQKTVIKYFSNLITNYDAVLLSDYGKGVLTYSLTQLLIAIAKKNNKKVLVDPKGLDYSKYKGAYLLTPNKKEASEATKINIKDNSSLLKAITKIKTECDLDVSIITLSDEGVAIYDDKLRVHPTVAREVYEVTGAGDTVLASLGFALACEYEIDEAVEFANLAAGVVVGKIGSAIATLNEIIEYESSLNKSTSDKHIKTVKEIALISEELKARGKKIIFTNGCFDILHLGHVKYLEKAKSFGDILIVGLNSDESVRRLKGENRPINSQVDRAYILASLEVIDYVVVFNDKTPINLIKQVQPDILVKGGDYEGKEIVGHDIAKEVKLVEFFDKKSTSSIIKRIKKDERNNS